MAIYYKTERMTSFVFEIRSVPFSSDMDRVRLELWLGLGSLFGERPGDACTEVSSTAKDWARSIIS